MALGVHLVRAGVGVVGAAVLLSASAVVVAGSSAAAATNLIANGSFESGGSYSFAGWKTQNATQAGVPSTAPGGGSFATAVSYSGAGASFQIFANPRPVLDTVGGTTYTATAWVKGAKKVCLTIKETTSLGAAVASSTAACATASAGAAVSATYTVAADHDQLGVVISQPAAAVAGDGFQADTVTLTSSQDLTAPTVPGALRVTSNSSTAVALAWDASSDPDDSASAITYHLYRDSVKIADISGPATTYSDTNVTAGVSYAYTIEATDAAGNGSGVSAPLMVTAGDTTKPTVPANLVQTGATATTISIAWDPSTDPDDATTALGYHVYRGTTLIATVATTGYTDTGRTASTSYGYRVDAFDPAGNTSAQSPSLTARTAADTTAPTVPANVTASALDTSRIKVSWTKSTDPDNAQTSLKYLVFRDGAATPIATVTTNTFTDTGLLQGTTHAYAVAGIDPAGNTERTVIAGVRDDQERGYDRAHRARRPRPHGQLDQHRLDPLDSLQRPGRPGHGDYLQRLPKRRTGGSRHGHDIVHRHRPCGRFQLHLHRRRRRSGAERIGTELRAGGVHPSRDPHRVGVAHG